MLSPLQRLDDLAGRITNRMIARLPGPLIEVPTDLPVVSFTFDDVPESAALAGAEILERHGVRGTFYIAGGLVGRREPERDLIDVQGCASLLARGHELGCHTYSHSKLRHMGRAEFERDLDRNAAFLSTLVPGFAARNFACPYNGGSFRQRRILARRYRSVRGGIAGVNRGPTDRTFLRAMAMQQPEHSMMALQAQIDALIAKPGWLIFFGHDITPSPTPYGCRPESFAALVGHAVASGCRVMTVDAALDSFGVAS